MQDVLHHLLIADGLLSRAAERAVAGNQAADFFDKAGGEHLFDTGVDPLVEFFARPGEDEGFHFGSGAAFVELRLQVAQPLAGELENFQAADDAALVVGMQLGGEQRVDHLQPLVQGAKRQRFSSSSICRRKSQSAGGP